MKTFTTIKYPTFLYYAHNIYKEKQISQIFNYDIIDMKLKV